MKPKKRKEKKDRNESPQRAFRKNLIGCWWNRTSISQGSTETYNHNLITTDFRRGQTWVDTGELDVCILSKLPVKV
jgi:hypothetical protein